MADIFDLAAAAPDGRSLPQERYGEGAIDDGGAVSAPTYFVAVLAAELCASALCILVGTKPMHVVGYVIAAVLVAVTVVTFRSVDRVRRRSSSYVSYAWPGATMVIGLVGGLVLALVHAYYFAQTRQIAP